MMMGLNALLRRAAPLAALALAAVGGLGCRQSEAPPLAAVSPSAGRPTSATQPYGIESSLRFREIAAQAGVRFTYYNDEEKLHASILESLGGGVGVMDYDGDGRLDLIFPGGGRYGEQKQITGLPTALFRQVEPLQFVRVEEPAGLISQPTYTHGLGVCDYNNDGFVDVVITGYGSVEFWVNQGDGTFVESHGPAGLDDASWSSSAGWGDLNGDGNADLYLAHYVDWSWENDPYCPGPTPEQREICAPKQYGPLPDSVYYSNGDGTFRNATAEAGLRPDGKGLSTLLVDVDGDNDLDIYVANDTTDNFLYLNDGKGKLEEVGMLCGVALDNEGIANGSMGIDLFDYNRDGRFDLWVANYERESFALYRNEGGGQYLHVSQSTGITALGGLFVGFGTACADLDRDGDEDIVVTNGHVIKFPATSPRRQMPLVLANDGARFDRVAFPRDHYLSTPQEGRGLALGDLDGDGDLDVTISHLNDPVAVLENQTPGGQWVAMRLIGTVSPRDAVGARLTLHTSVGDLIRQIKGGASYLSHSDPVAFWGLPDGAAVQGATIHWPSGQVQQVAPALNAKTTVIEATGQP